MNSKENITLSSLTAISPIDGRYWNITNKLSEYYSEFGLIKKRIYIEIEYFFKLCETIPELEELNLQKYNKKIKNIYENFTIQDAEEIKDIEKTTNHDVKSVEYFIKKKFIEIGLSKYTEYIHFGLTSQDINNTAIPYLLSKSLKKLINPVYSDIKNKIYDLASKWIKIPMLSRTHGQPASPTYLGKEMFVFYERIFNQVNQLDNCRLLPYH